MGLRCRMIGVSTSQQERAKFCSQKKTFDFTTRLAAYTEGIAGIERHILPVAQRWLDEMNKTGAAG